LAALMNKAVEEILLLDAREQGLYPIVLDQKPA
jgi:hypothetical protein